MPHFEYDKDYPFAAFITNLGKYNEGELVGEWVKFPTTADELKKAFERIGIGSEDDFGNPYEEWFITDYDCYVGGLYNKVCLGCAHGCKQSFRAVLIACPRYFSKRSKNCGDKGGKTAK